jgi:hypothetical protein
VPRHEDVLTTSVLLGAPSATTPHVVDVVPLRDQEAAEVDRLAVLDHRAAEERPRRVVAARRPLPRAADEVAAVDAVPAPIGVARRRARSIVAPTFLRLLIEQREVPPGR